MMQSNEIFLLRHLKTENNELHIISGQSESSILHTYYDKVDFSDFGKLYCSPSPRCINTLRFLGCELSNVIIDSRLLERNMGSLEGKTKEECKMLYGNLFCGNNFDVFKTPPNGESYKYFYSRVHDFYLENIHNNSSSVVICSHNQTMRMLRLIILNKDITHAEWVNYNFKNGILTNIFETNV